ncbi:MAG: hypothetical protein IJV08_11115, partial [Bacteroidaceae bacterium]|nr:hypothetical protein [Bacteroidaceae bacterium]
MGWNLKGQPWLVGRFVTGGTNPDFQMDVPHLFYSMQGDGTYSKAAGQMYTTRSWDEGADIRLGDGVFTQTAIIGTEELLTFKRPVFSDEAVAPARMLVAVTRRNVSGSNGANEPDEFRNCFSDYVELHPQEGADAAMPYKLGSDGIKWFGYGVEAPGLFVVNEAETPLSLVSSAPIGVDIRLGLLTHADGDELTIGLPDAEAFAAYDHVWLTDHLLNRVTDLKDSDYTLTVDEAACYTNRLTLRIGGVLPADEPGAADEASYRIYTRRNRLFIEGLQPGDHILVYNAGGALVENCRATNETYQRDLYSGTYIVRVNNVVKKVLAHR